MNFLFLIGQIMLGGYFLMNAFNHVMKVGALSGYAKAKGVAYPHTAVLGSGFLLFLGGLGILFGVWVGFSVTLLVIFLLGVSFKIHAFWNEEGAAGMADYVNFTKNMALIGALLLIAMIPTPWAYSLF